MRTLTANWFICKVSYTRSCEDGLVKKVTESYVIDAASFGDAEVKIVEEVAPFSHGGDIAVDDISKAQFKEVFFSDRDDDDRWYKAKVQFITIDEVNAREKRTSVTYLVQGKSINGAVKAVDEVMSSTMTTYSSVAVQETSFMDVICKQEP